MILTLLWACSGGGSLEVPPGRTEPVEPAPTAPGPAPQGQAYHRTDQGASPLTCDAGDVAWVQRVMPLLWGRRPHGAAEVDLWVQVAAQQGREAVVRAMARDPEYRDAWLDCFADAMYVARTGDKEYARCF